MGIPSATGLDLDALAELLQARIGFQLPASRRTDLAAAARRVLSRYRPAHGQDPLQALAADRRSFDALVSEVTIAETYFFRDPGQFDVLRDRLVPALRAERGPQHVLKIWSAGCATGEEAYSLAALMLETGQGPFQVVGTDVCADSLDHARRASYGPWSLRGEGRQRMDPFLRQAGSRWHVAARIRAQVDFQIHNLAGPGAGWAALQGMDLILCRNVMIYFGTATIRQVAEKLHGVLAPGGVLLTGPSDPLLGELAPFSVEVTPFGVFYRRSDGSAAAKRPLLAVPRAPGPGMQVSAATPLQRRSTVVARSVARPAAAIEPAAILPAATLPAADSPGEALAEPYRDAMRRLGERDAAGAEKILRRLLYLDRHQAVLHFGLGVSLLAQGRVEAARRAFRNATNLASAKLPGQFVLLGDGVTAGELARAAKSHLASLPAEGG